METASEHYQEAQFEYSDADKSILHIIPLSDEGRSSASDYPLMIRPIAAACSSLHSPRGICAQKTPPLIQPTCCGTAPLITRQRTALSSSIE
jgi:hypothetical protein